MSLLNNTEELKKVFDRFLEFGYTTDQMTECMFQMILSDLDRNTYWMWKDSDEADKYLEWRKLNA